jgi:hypothetical protein
MRMAARIRLPPIVGVPFLAMCRGGTSSLTTCRIWKTLNFLINQGPMIKLMRRAVKIE